MAKKNASGSAKGADGVAVTVDTKAAVEGGNLSSDPVPTVKVNNAHLQEIKSALDDAVKKVGLILPNSSRACCKRTG